MKPEAAWPDPPEAAAFQGLAGELVAAVDPHTEADKVAVLAHSLAVFSAAVGPRPHFYVGATEHRARLNKVIVGRTSKARKGDSYSPVRTIFRRADQRFITECVQTGLATGEGLIRAVRDPVYKLKDGVQVVAEEGAADKRLLALESEFSRVLKVTHRESNILSEILRCAWDDGNLRTMTSTSPLRATGAHVSVIGHITVEELKRELTATEQANGLANRFLWVLAERSKLLPEPEPIPEDVIAELADRLKRQLDTAKNIDVMSRDSEAKALWAERYAELSQGREGLAGAVISRAEAQVLRLSMVYALLDGTCKITRQHLEGALEFWRYCEDSARYLFGEASGDPTEDRIASVLRTLQEMGEPWVSRNDIYDGLGRHVPRARIDLALESMRLKGKAKTETRPTGGRPVEMWAWAAR